MNDIVIDSHRAHLPIPFDKRNMRIANVLWKGNLSEYLCCY